MYRFLYRFPHYVNHPISVNYTSIRRYRGTISQALLMEGCGKQHCIPQGELYVLGTSSDLLIQEIAMKKFYEALSILVALPLFITSCGTHTLPVETEVPSVQKYASYELVLDRSIMEKEVINFIVSNQCSPANQFQLCKEVGMALWADSDQVVKTVYLYAGDAQGFRRYRGELPFGLTFYDPMWKVQEKLRDSNAADSLHQAGLPDEASSPDHIHYWAVYKRYGMTIIYASPSADEDAYIYAILISS